LLQKAWAQTQPVISKRPQARQPSPVTGILRHFSADLDSHSQVRTWCSKRRPRAVLPARWPRSATGARPTGIGLHVYSTAGCLRCSTVTMPTMASRGTFGGYRNIATKSRGSGTSGWNVEREVGQLHGPASTRSSPVTPCQRPGSSTDTPPGTKLSREEPNALVAHVRVCGGRGGQPPRLPGVRQQVSCQDFVITIREGRHQFSWHKKQEQSRISPSDTVAVLTFVRPQSRYWPAVRVCSAELGRQGTFLSQTMCHQPSGRGCGRFQISLKHQPR